MRCAWVGIAICVVAATSRADNTAEKKAEAEVVFREAVKLRDEGRLTEACAKFSRALDLDEHAAGSLLNVALCDEKLGRVASAYKRFQDAQQRAKDQGLTEHQKAAEAHLATLAPQVPYVKLTFAEVLPDTKVLIDDAVVDPSGEIALDPGTRVLLVTHRDRLPFETKLVIRLGEHQPFEVPALARSVTVKSSPRTLGKIVTFSGIGAVAIGVGLGLYARNLYNDQVTAINPLTMMAFCVKMGDSYRCPSDQHNQTEHARVIGDAGAVIGSVGLVAIGVGAYLWLRAPAEVRPTVSVLPTLSLDSIGLAAMGHF